MGSWIVGCVGPQRTKMMALRLVLWQAQAPPQARASHHTQLRRCCISSQPLRFKGGIFRTRIPRFPPKALIDGEGGGLVAMACPIKFWRNYLISSLVRFRLGRPVHPRRSQHCAWAHFHDRWTPFQIPAPTPTKDPALHSNQPRNRRRVQRPEFPPFYNSFAPSSISMNLTKRIAKPLGLGDGYPSVVGYAACRRY